MPRKKKAQAPNPLDKFVYMDDVKSLLDIAFTTDTNVILFGPGGHGKSEITLEYLRGKGIEPFVQTMGQGMTKDMLFGGMDIKKFTETGKLEFLLDNSFMNHEYVIFEELFDAPDYILEQLKDILSSGYYRNGGQKYKVKTKLIFCNTNRTREDFVKNASLKALMERFPLEHEVKWKDYNKLTYENLLNVTTGSSDPMLTYILDKFARKNHIISPRIAIKSLELINSCGPDCLKYIADFKIEEDLLKESIAGFESLFKLKKMASELEVLHQEIHDLNVAALTDIGEIKDAGKKINKYRIKIKSVDKIKADESLVSEKAEIVKSHTDALTEFKATLKSLVEVESGDTTTPTE